jgi:hypothetical protein
MPLATVGILTPIDFAAEQRTVILPTVRQVFVNETPLIARLPRDRAESESYTITSYDVRGRAFVVGTGGILIGGTSLPIADASVFMVGDVLELQAAAGGAVERAEVTAAPTLTTTPNTLTIRRAVEGTTAAGYAAADTVRLIGNSRTGGEVNQQAERAARTTLVQNVQTFQFPVQVGGKANAILNATLPQGVASLFGMDRAIKLTEMMRDEEYTSYYGMGDKPVTSGDRAKQKGLRTLISSYNAGANVKTTGGASYTRATFIADTVQKIFDAGGMPDTIICSTDFLGGLTTWAPNVAPTAGQEVNRIGLRIREFQFPLIADPMTIIPCLQLRKGTAAVLTSDDLMVRQIRPEQWIPRGSRGDAIEGDWVSDVCMHMGHPQWHAWVEGITSFA